MRVIVKKWGDTASVSIPADIMAAANLSLDQAVEMHEEGGRIVIEPIQSEFYDLDKLLAEITPENIHSEVSFGSPVGHEVF